MELGLTLGNPQKPFAFLPNTHKPPTTNTGTLDFCMALGLNTNNNAVQPPENTQDSDEASTEDDDGGGDKRSHPHLQLNLVANPLQISLPWSSDNGSSENGSSGNMGLPTARRLNVNRLPAAAEEVSSANSMGSPFGLYRNGNLLGGNSKRDFESIGNDVVDGVSRGSDDDESGPNGRKKLRLSKEQSAFLEESFKEHSTLNPKQKLALAKQLNLRPRQVEVWFQNRRARTKLKQTEVDCEYLKRCCETLSEENRRLHKELQELRALKTSNPFYMQSPATTLTMCPSCERVATTATPSGAKASNRPVESAPKTGPFPLTTTRPRFYPFSQSPSRSNQPAAS